MMRNLMIVTTLISFMVLAGCGGQGDENTKSNATAAKPVTSEIVVSVDDMHCDACVKAITNKLQKLPGVVQVQVSLESKTARTTVDKKTGPTADQIIEAVKALGYEKVRPGDRPATATAPASATAPAKSATPPPTTAGTPE